MVRLSLIYNLAIVNRVEQPALSQQEKITLCLISEATGNEGATKELWYHRGAIIMWPEKRDLEIVFKSDIAFAVHHLKKLIKEGDVKEGESRKTAIQLAHHIIDNKKSTDLQGLMEYFITLGDVGI